MLGDIKCNRTTATKFAFEAVSTVPVIGDKSILPPPTCVFKGDPAAIKTAVQRQLHYQQERQPTNEKRELLFKTDANGSVIHPASIRIIDGSNPSTPAREEPLSMGTMPPSDVKTFRPPKISDTISLFHLDEEQQLPFAVMIDRYDRKSV